MAGGEESGTGIDVGSSPAAFAAALQTLQDHLGYTFAAPELLIEALTHSTYANEQRPPGRSYERLEFLGDAVLQLVVSEHLFAARPEANEGELSRCRSTWVREATLAHVARGLRLAGCMRMGVGARQTPVPQSVLADGVEAVLAALYVDSSRSSGPAAALAAAGNMIVPRVQAALEAAPAPRDSKTQLQELCHSLRLAQPVYTVIDIQGPAHARVYQVELVVISMVPVRASASSKQAAQQACAQQVLATLRA